MLSRNLRLAKDSLAPATSGLVSVRTVGDAEAGADGVLELRLSRQLGLDPIVSRARLLSVRSVCERAAGWTSEGEEKSGVVALRPPLAVRLRGLPDEGASRFVAEGGGRVLSSAWPVELPGLELELALLASRLLGSSARCLDSD